MNSVFKFDGKVVFVTGGASGIGRATALAFAQAGARVAVADVGEQANQETARLIEQNGGRALAVRCDVTRGEDIKAALEKTVTTFGRLDFAFNNAGIEPKKPAPTADYDEQEWNRIIDIDLRGVFLCMKHEIPLILKSGGGAIVNTSSGAGVIGIKGSPAYTAAKHGVIGLSKAAAVEYASKGIRVNALAPGLVNTAMTKAWFDDPNMSAYFAANTPIGRVSQPAEIAGMVLFLCSDLASFAVGQTFIIDGGYTTH